MLMTAPINNDYQLESAHLDWYSLRTQIALGLTAIFCLCLTNFLPVWQNNQSVVESYDSIFIPASLQPILDIPLKLLDFGLYFSSCLLVALITLEITGRFGNRIRASCAIWAALIFCVFPWQIIDYFVTDRFNRLLTLLILVSLYLFLKIESNRLIFWTLLILVCTLSFSMINNHQLPISQSIGLFIFPVLMPLFKHSLSVHVLELGYLTAGSILLVRILCRTLKWPALSTIGLCVIAICLLPGQTCSYLSWGTLASAALAITISLICLPGLDTASVRISRLLGCLGLVALIALTIIYEQLFLSYQGQMLSLPNISAKHHAQKIN